MKVRISILLILLLAACNMPGGTAIPIPTATRESPHATPSPEPSSTDMLPPYNDSITKDNQGALICSQPVEIGFPTSDAKNWSREQIGMKLFETYLAHYRHDDIPQLCRITAFRIDKVEQDPYSTRALKVNFSIQVEQVPTNWVAGNGEFAPEGWIVNKLMFITYSASGTDYVLELMGSGP